MQTREPISYSSLSLRTVEDVLAADIPEDARRDFLEAIELRDSGLDMDDRLVADVIWYTLRYFQQRAAETGVPVGVLVKSMRVKDVIATFIRTGS